MKCYVCDVEENWHSLKELNPKRELLVCKDCGNIAYRVEPMDHEKTLEYYRKEYRPAPTHLNLITTSNKLNYIKCFLGDWIKDKKNMVCGDIGCATGYLVRWLRVIGHRATGCEYTLTYRRFAEHFYGFPITEDLPHKYQYDFLSIYHVLEHITDPDKKLADFLSLLHDDDSRIMVATPQWLNTLEEASGAAMQDFTQLFHKDHINVFTANSLQRLFAKCGLAIVKEDHIQYGQTYLLRKLLPNENKSVLQIEPWERQVELIHKTKEAIDKFKAGKYREAIDVYPAFPEAWLKLIFETQMKQPEAQEETWGKVQKILPENARLRFGHGMWLYQRQDLKSAREQFDWIMKHKPSADVAMHLGFCFAQEGDHKAALVYFEMAAEMHPPRWQESIGWACREAGMIPTWDERAKTDIKDKLFLANEKKIIFEPVDPLMDALISANGEKSESIIEKKQTVDQEPAPI